MGFFKKLKERVTSPEATVSFKLNKNSFALGEKLEGTLTVTSEEEFDATEIRAEIRCEEKKRTLVRETSSDGRVESRLVWETQTIYTENPQGSGPVHLSAGYKGEFPFSTSIPAGGQVTYSGGDRNITWTIKGVIGVKGRPDVTSSESNIQIVAAPMAPITPAVTEKIIEREVVMIPCQYCGTLFAQTATSCPHCGAKRKI